MAVTRVTTVVLPLVPVIATKVGRGGPAAVKAAPRQLDLGDDRYPDGGGQGEDGVADGYARARHHAAGRGDQLGQSGRVRGLDQHRAELRGNRPGLFGGVVVDDRHLVTRRQKGSGHGPPGDDRSRTPPWPSSRHPPVTESRRRTAPRATAVHSPGEDPEADDDGRLGPADQLEVVVDRRHAEHPAVEDPKAGDLDDHRQRLDDEQAADDRAAAGRRSRAGPGRRGRRRCRAIRCRP